MAERYQVRGLRIWDSVRNTYSDLLTNIENTEGLTCDDDHLWTFKPLAEWQDDKSEGDDRTEPRYKAVGRRILDTKTDTWSKDWKDDDSAIFIAKWCNAGNAGDIHFLSISEWDEVEKRISNDVNHPSHYTQGPVECIDAIASALGRDAFIEFLRGQVIKYMWRLGHKGDALKDAEKGTWYASRLVAELAK